MGTQWYKTIADLFADALSTRPGDRVFFQLTGRNPGGVPANLNNYLEHIDLSPSPSDAPSGNGFTGVAEVSGPPFFDPTAVGHEAKVPDSLPLRVPIDCNRYLPNPVSEERALSYKHDSTELWNPKYKKTIRGAKSLTSITPSEGDQLLELINGANDREYKVTGQSYPGDASQEISINDRLGQEDGSTGVRSGPPDSIADLSLDEIPIVSGSRFKVEKTLEAWLMEMIDSEHKGLRQVFGPVEELEWFSNYIPYGVSGKNMDGLAFHSRDGIQYKISTIELKRGKAGTSALNQVMGYARWVSNFLADGDSSLIQPILIARDFSEDAVRIAKAQIGPRPPMLVSYEIVDESCVISIDAGHPVSYAR